MIYSKLLCEVVTVENTNDRLDVMRASPAETLTLVIAPGRYRDHVALCAEIESALNALAWTAPAPTWTCGVDNVTGLVTFTCDEDWDPDWKVSSYGTILRNALGFTGLESVDGSYALEASSIHLGGFYPSEPVESDDRPLSYGTDRWQNDAVQQSGRSGVIATVGGGNQVRRRSITFLLAQADLEAFSTWLQHVGQGFSFAFYHDRTRAWPGLLSEYDEYKLVVDGDAGVSYAPERVEPNSNLWHRATLQLQQRVAPTP